ncbi:MAG: outer membrane protein assembly factor BamA [Bacteroidales bacterium]
MGLLASFNYGAYAQEEEVIEKPNIYYSSNPKKYEIGGISITGAKNYEDYVLIGFSGLTIGQQITVPGPDITNAVNRFWKHGLFSDVSITADKIVGDKIFLNIDLKQRPRISKINYLGLKKSEREDIDAKIGFINGNQITPNQIERAKFLIKKYFDEKGFNNAEITIVQKDDLSKENQVIVDVVVDKKEKVKVNQIHITGNSALSENKIERVMKKTNEKKKLLNLFRTKKFVPENFDADKELILEKYNELGYRDAVILSDSVVKIDDKNVDIYLNIDEGNKYHVRSIKWIGNTIYPSDLLNAYLKLKPGDVYNQKLINERTQTDEDAISNLYMDKGYLFFHVEPVEINIQNDSVDLEMRIQEGKQATINKVTITGNDRLYEHVVRRELRTKPGQLFSKSDLQRSLREIAQTGHFNPENLVPDIQPDPENGTVDIGYPLESKANDQIEFSAGWGQTGIIGKLSLKFTNFSIKNLLNPSSYKGIIPQGDGQTLTISAQTNARYYQQYSVSFFDPWFGGKRPNSLSVSAFYSRQSDINSNYTSSYNPNYGYGGYGYPGYGYGGGYGYGNGYGYDYDPSFAYDPDQNFQQIGVALGFGKRLSWPDDYFTFSAELSYQRYMMKDWKYFIISNGSSNNLSLNLTLSRNSLDNPVYTRRGSQFSLSLGITPPYSLLGEDKKIDYTDPKVPLSKKFKWVEYHKWKFKARTFTPISPNEKLVLATRVEYGFLGQFNKNKKSPFETFYMGGDGMSGYSSTYLTETIALRGYENGSLTPYGRDGYAYSRLGVELRYPLMLQPSSTIYALSFLEAGNAWYDVKNFNPFDLKRSAGAGVRILLPMIGMLGIDWAYGFDKVFGTRDHGGSQFHFIIGQEF